MLLGRSGPTPGVGSGDLVAGFVEPAVAREPSCRPHDDDRAALRRRAGRRSPHRGTRLVWLRQFEPGSKIPPTPTGCWTASSTSGASIVRESLFHTMSLRVGSRGCARQGERYFADELRELPEMFLADAVVEPRGRGRWLEGTAAMSAASNGGASARRVGRRARRLEADRLGRNHDPSGQTPCMTCPPAAFAVAAACFRLAP